MDRPQRMTIDLSVWGPINLWWVERWFIYGIEESPGLPESDSATTDFLTVIHPQLLPHSCPQPSLHLSSQQCNLQPQGCKARLQPGWKLVVCLRQRNKPQAPPQASAAVACLYRTHMQKLTPRVFCTIRCQTTAPGLLLLLRCRTNVPCCRVSSGCHSPSAAAQLQSGRFC